MEDAGKLEYASCHFACTTVHQNGSFSIFWDVERTAVFLRSRQKVAKYPLMGLAEIGNVTSSCPEVTMAKKDHSLYFILGVGASVQAPSALRAWPPSCRGEVHLTYAQAYTPLTKSMDNKHPFCDHPYLLTALLGRDYVATSGHFRSVHKSTNDRKEFRLARAAHTICFTRGSS